MCGASENTSARHCAQRVVNNTVRHSVPKITLGSFRVGVEKTGIISGAVQVTRLVLFVGVNAGGGDKDQKNETDKKTEVDLELAVC